MHWFDFIGYCFWSERLDRSGQGGRGVGCKWLLLSKLKSWSFLEIWIITIYISLYVYLSLSLADIALKRCGDENLNWP